METKQKKWLWVFLAMFIVPEVLFSFLLSTILFFFRINFTNLAGELFGEQFFIDNQIFLFITLVIELLGVVGLLVFNAKSNQRYKAIFSILLSIILIILLLTLYAGFTLRNGIGF